MDTMGAWPPTSWKWSQPLVVLGPAGSGKSTTVMMAVEEAQNAGARVLVACPTRLLVADYREEFPGLDVDSVHAAFQVYKREEETLAAMEGYDLIVIDEISQLSAALFDRLIRIWSAAGRWPALVFLGDFSQLRGVDETLATQGAHWHE
eukprot:12918747-Prorocentrum_lima.AAC.1